MAAVIEETLAPTETLNELRVRYLASRKHLDAAEHPDAGSGATLARDAFRARLEFGSAASDYAAKLVAEAQADLAAFLDDLFGEAGLHGPRCLHIVWSDFAAYRPRQLHIWPEGDREYDGSSGGLTGTSSWTICGRRVYAASDSHRWFRAVRGEWREWCEAVDAERGRGDDQRSYGISASDRVCEQCRVFERHYAECWEELSGVPPRWPDYKRRAIAIRATERMRGRLDGRPPAAAKARRLAQDLAAGTEIEAAAEELHRRGLGAVETLVRRGSPGRLDIRTRAGSLPTYSEWVALLESRLSTLRAGQAPAPALADLFLAGQHRPRRH